VWPLAGQTFHVRDGPLAPRRVHRGVARARPQHASPSARSCQQLH
jgi:hypothetical protein